MILPKIEPVFIIDFSTLGGFLISIKFLYICLCQNTENFTFYKKTIPAFLCLFEHFVTPCIFSIWVGSLTEDVTSDQLFDFFAERYPSTVGAKVVFDQDGQSRGFGFVNMMDEEQFRMSCSDMKGGTGLGGNPLEIRAGLTNVFANKNSAECQAWIEGRENRQAFEAAKAAIVANYNTNVKDDYEMNHQLEKYAVDETDDPDELVDHKFAVLEDVRELNKQFLYDHFETMCLPFSLYTPLDIGKTKFSDDHVRAWFQ